MSQDVFFKPDNKIIFRLIFRQIDNQNNSTKGSVFIIDKNSYYEVILDYNSGKTPYDIGREYGQKISQAVPAIAELLDIYISQISDSSYFYNEYIKRVNDIKPQFKQKYIDELESLAEMANTRENIFLCF